MTIIALAILALLLPFVLFDLVARPTIRRIALRNVVRRPGEAILIVAGSLLATALITASFIIGDSFDSSIRNIAVDRYGPVDEIVNLSDPSEIAVAVETAQTLPPELVDGVLGAAVIDVAAGSTGADRMVAPEVRVLEVDPAAAVAFAGDAELLGPDGAAALGSDDVVINQRVADKIGASVGDRIEVFLGGEPVGFDVAAVRPATGLNGLGELMVAEGSITGLVDDPAAVAGSVVLVSNVGDVFSGADLTDDTVVALEAAFGPDVEVDGVKQDLLLDAEAEGAEMTELFGTVGGFSVIAGILLVVNLFVMLAGERKSEMGTLRATGLRRGHLVRAFSMEGATYGLLAAILGTGVGVGVAAVVMAMASDLFDGDFAIKMSVVPGSLVSGAVIGLAVSQVTVLLTSWRTTRLNIVRALRDLPEPMSAGRGWRGLAAGAVGIVVGVGLYSLAGTDPIVAMLAPALAIVSLVPVLSRIVPRRIATIACSGAALFWVAAVFGLLPEVMEDPDIILFLMQGVLLVGLATVIVAMLDKVWMRLARAVTGGGIASRLGLAEPLARPVRSALLVAMYALVIFTVTFMAVMNAVFQAQAPDFAVQASGGYDLYVDANPTSGLSAEELGSRGDVAAVAPVRRGFVHGGFPEETDEWGWRISGIDEAFLAVDPPALFARADEFTDDADVWAAVAAGGPYVIVDEDTGLAPGDEYRFRGDTGAETTVTVAGTTQQGWLVRAGAIVGDGIAVELFGDDRPVTRHYVAVAPGADPADVATDLTNGGAERSIDARTFLGAAKAATDEQEGFLNLLQGYLGLGLLIGIAGLGVVLIRAVRERRRQFGVMRALGIAAPVIRRAFVVEAGFVALQGVVLGIGLGLLSSWQVLTRSSAFEEGLGFTVPITTLAVLAVGCFAASLVISAVPAIRAGRTSPAVALRVAT